MGTPVPPPIVPDPVGAGDDYIECWGIGKPFGDDDTPGQVTASVSGINKGPAWFSGDGEPQNGVFTLTQSIILPNVFNMFTATHGFSLAFSTPISSFVIFNIALAFQFLNEVGFPCPILFQNQITDKFVGGSVLITIPEVE